MLPSLSCVQCCVCLPFPFVFIRVLPGSCPISFEKSFFRLSRPNVHPTCCCSAASSDIALDYAGRQLISIDGGCIFMVTGSKLCKYYLSGLDYRGLLCPIIKPNMRDQSKITFIAASQASGVKLRSSEAGKFLVVVAISRRLIRSSMECRGMETTTTRKELLNAAPRTTRTSTFGIIQTGQHNGRISNLKAFSTHSLQAVSECDALRLRLRVLTNFGNH
jgi:hypothetical protein